MKKILILIFLLPICQLDAQFDREFWFAVPAHVPLYTSVLNKPVILRLLTKDKAADIKISIPTNSSFKPISEHIDANSFKSIDLTSYLEILENREVNKVLKRGLLIESSENIIAYYDMVSSPADAEFYALKGKIALGTYFVIPGQKEYYNHNAYNPLPKNTVAIVATEDTTEVFITPSNDAVGHKSKTRFKIILNRGETYCIESSSQSSNLNLTGTLIESDKPIAVTMNDDLLSVSFCQDALGDQILPFSSLGTEYAIVPGKLNTEKVQIISTEDNNEILVNGVKIKTLKRNEFYYLALTENTFISSKFPIYVFHISGIGCEISATTILPFTCSGLNSISYEFNKVKYENNDLQFLLVVAKGSENEFYLNDTMKVSGKFTPFKSKSDILGGIIDVYNYPYNQTLKLSNKKSSFSVGFLVGGGDTPGAKYVYLNDIQQDDRISYSIVLPEINANRSDSVIAIPIKLETISSKYPVDLYDLNIVFEINEDIISVDSIHNGVFTTNQTGGKYLINCIFPYIKVNSAIKMIDTLFCTLIKKEESVNSYRVSECNLQNNPCNTVNSTEGIIAISCGDYSFTYDGFNDISNLKFDGVAKKINDFVRLTYGAMNKTGLVYFKHKISFNYSFTTNFRFRFLDGNNNNCKDNSDEGADGIVFIIANTENLLGYSGGAIGYEGIKNCFALEFDTFSNDSTQIENFNDPNGNHVAIQVQKDLEINPVHTLERTLALNRDILKLKTDGTVYFCRIEYQKFEKILRVFLDTNERFVNPIMELKDFNFSDILNLENNEKAYFGFTSATGCAYEIHDLLYWDFCSLKPGQIVNVEEQNQNIPIESVCCSRNINLAGLNIENSYHAELFDLFGRLVYSSILDGEQMTLPNSISIGTYFLRIYQNNNSSYLKIIISE